MLPRGWHFPFFIAATRQSTLPEDGFPPITEPGIETPANARVMLGGRRAEFIGDIAIGQSIRRVRKVVDVSSRSARSGVLTIVTRRHDIYAGGDNKPCIIEHEDMIYRAPSPAAAETSAAPQAEPASPNKPSGEIYSPDPTALFRYSALTFNAHRIHYDSEYAIEAEGYPGLVVNGGLTALVLLQLFRRETGQAPAQVATRNRAPLFCGQPATLNMERQGEAWRLWASNPSGAPAIEMVAR